jgi:hypothetical protein
MSLQITGLTLSVEFGDMEYNKGTKSFMNLSARCPEGAAIPLDNPNEAIIAGLDMYLTAWTTLMNARLASRIINKTEFETGMLDLKKRIGTLKARLYQVDGPNQEHVPVAGG